MSAHDDKMTIIRKLRTEAYWTVHQFVANKPDTVSRDEALSTLYLGLMDYTKVAS